MTLNWAQLLTRYVTPTESLAGRSGTLAYVLRFRWLSAPLSLP